MKERATSQSITMLCLNKSFFTGSFNSVQRCLMTSLDVAYGPL